MNAHDSPLERSVYHRSALLLLALSMVLHAASASSRVNGYVKGHYVLPPQVAQKGVSFCGTRVPLERKDVAERVSDQLDFLLMDRRALAMERFDRMVQWGPVVKATIETENAPPDLLYLAVLLSDMAPAGTTRTGAVGLWALGSTQQKKGTPAPWLVTGDWDDRRDPVLSTKIAVSLIQGFMAKPSKPDWLLAIASFVDGPEKIDSLMRSAPGYPAWDLVLPPLSDGLLPRLVALKLIDTHRGFYGVDSEPVATLPYDYLDRLKLQKDLPLSKVAKWCAVPPRSMRELNPGVDAASGMLPKVDKRNTEGLPLRVPKGTGPKVKELLAKDGYWSP